MKHSTQHQNQNQYERWIPDMRRQVARRQVAGAALPLAIVLALALVAAGSAQAQTYTYNILHEFTGSADGANPLGGLVLDAQGNLYGTAWFGGDPACGCGVVFKLDTRGNQTILYSFTAGDGHPWGNLAMDAAGNLYGATYSNGTIYEVDTNGNQTVLYSFTGGADGGEPTGGLVRDDQGNLYGTTYMGGNSDCPYSDYPDAGCGTVFALDPAGNLTVLYTFCSQVNCTDGASPNGGLVRDAQGNLYGTTQLGGAYKNAPDMACNLGCGAVFKIDASGNQTVLHSFDFNPRKGRLDGATPDGGLAMDGQGNLYGTTASGGAGAKHRGTVFKVDASGNESVLYSFGGTWTAPDFPVGTLIVDGAGNLYGTTETGGPKNDGTVFMLDTSANLTVLLSFDGKNGANPSTGVVMDAAGNLYGTAFVGGLHAENCDTTCGVVYDLLPPSAGAGAQVRARSLGANLGSGRPAITMKHQSRPSSPSAASG